MSHHLWRRRPPLSSKAPESGSQWLMTPTKSGGGWVQPCRSFIQFHFIFKKKKKNHHTLKCSIFPAKIRVKKNTTFSEISLFLALCLQPSEEAALFLKPLMWLRRLWWSGASDMTDAPVPPLTSQKANIQDCLICFKEKIEVVSKSKTVWKCC